MSKMTLYEINDQLALLDLDSIIDEETGEILNQEGLRLLNELTLAKEEKEVNLALLIKNLEAEAEAINQEKNKLAKREKTLDNKIDWLKSYLRLSLNGEKINDPRVSVTYRAGMKIVADNPLFSEIPQEFLRVANPELNKVEIKKQLKEESITEEELKQWNITIDRTPSMCIK